MSYIVITIKAAAGETRYVRYHIYSDGNSTNGHVVLQTVFAELKEAEAFPILLETKKIQ
jgi:hypothetical protein